MSLSVAVPSSMSGAHLVTSHLLDLYWISSSVSCTQSLRPITTTAPISMVSQVKDWATTGSCDVWNPCWPSTSTIDLCKTYYHTYPAIAKQSHPDLIWASNVKNKARDIPEMTTLVTYPSPTNEPTIADPLIMPTPISEGNVQKLSNMSQNAHNPGDPDHESPAVEVEAAIKDQRESQSLHDEPSRTLTPFLNRFYAALADLRSRWF